MSNMTKLDELKQKELNILDFVVDFCDKQGINYWLDYGTLIGAVRHKGFIPWDDDIDIGMLRDDFERFQSTFNEYVGNNSRYIAEWTGNCKNETSNYLFIKVLDKSTIVESYGRSQNVWIDIFPYDNIPADEKTFIKMFKKSAMYIHGIRLQNNTHKPAGNFIRRACVRFARFCARCLPEDYFSKKQTLLVSRFKNIDSKEVVCFCSARRSLKENNISRCEKEVFLELTELEFEGKMYKVPKNYDRWLTIAYGDYMTLPPEEERIDHNISNITFLDYDNDGFDSQI